MRKVSVIALSHPDHPELFLHMLRTDNHKWTLPSGSANPGELANECAARELQEETGLQIKEMEACRNGCFESDEPHGVHVSLFHAPFPVGADLDAFKDPDQEGVAFKFLNPLAHDNLHIEGDRNILIQHLKQGLNKFESLEKKELDSKLGYTFKYLKPKLAEGPYSLHTITAHDKTGKQIGHLVAEDVGDGDYMPNYIEVNPEHRRLGIGGKMHQLMQRHTGLRAIPDLAAQSAPALAMWKDPKRKFGKSELTQQCSLMKDDVSSPPVKLNLEKLGLKLTANSDPGPAPKGYAYQSSVQFHGYKPVKQTGNYRQYHFTKDDLANILQNWDSTSSWTPYKVKNRGVKDEHHYTALPRKDITVPIRDYLANTPRKQSGMNILYHGVGRDEVSANALAGQGHQIDKYDPFHNDPSYRTLPKGPYDEVHSHYTLNVVPRHVGKQILQEIHSRMHPNSKAVISVRAGDIENQVMESAVRSYWKKKALKAGMSTRVNSSTKKGIT